MNIEQACYFCKLQHDQILIDGHFACVLADNFPVTQGHSLIITKRHVGDFFDLNNDELVEIHQLLVHRKKQIQDQDSTVEGFNVGANVGLAAGQSIFHVHVHLIPRRIGDLENPKGGVRGVLPDKRNY